MPAERLSGRWNGRTLMLDPGAWLDANALAEVPSGAVIRLGPGEYFVDGLAIDRPIELAGAGPREQVVVHILTPLGLRDGVVRGVTLYGRHEAQPQPAGCMVFVPSGSPQLIDCDLKSVHGSLLGVEGAAPVVRGCRLIEAADSGVIAAAGARL